jgi:hypothetical protein
MDVAGADRLSLAYRRIQGHQPHLFIVSADAGVLDRQPGGLPEVIARPSAGALDR